MATFRFQNGVCYSAHIQLRGVEALFGGKSDVAAEIAKLGLRNVQVTELPGDAYVASGTWTLPTQTVTIPSQVTTIVTCGKQAPTPAVQPAVRGVVIRANPPRPKRVALVIPAVLLLGAAGVVLASKKKKG